MPYPGCVPSGPTPTSSPAGFIPEGLRGPAYIIFSDNSHTEMRADEWDSYNVVNGVCTFFKCCMPVCIFTLSSIHAIRFLSPEQVKKQEAEDK